MSATTTDLSTAQKLSLLGALYFAQGLPFGFFTQALPVMLRAQQVSLPAIGLTSLLAIPWALKFLWAPAVDRYGSRRFGRRRSWIIPLQAASALTVAALALVAPEGLLGWLMAGVLLINLLAATQDIATDALAVDLLSHGERGLGNGLQVAGYRAGMIVGGGALLIVFSHLGQATTFLSMAALLALSTVPLLFYREGAPRQDTSGQAEGEAIRMGAIVDFVRRPGMKAWLLVLVAYKAGDALATGMLRPFLVDLGLELSDIGWILGTAGFLAGLVGALVGGWAVGLLGRRRAVLLFGVLQSIAVLSYAWLALAGPSSTLLLYGACTVEHFTGGMATAALFTLMMDAARARTAATDYTLQACVVVLATGTATALSGFLAEALGYFTHFLISAALAVVGALSIAAFLGRGWALSGDGVDRGMSSSSMS